MCVTCEGLHKTAHMCARVCVCVYGVSFQTDRHYSRYFFVVYIGRTTIMKPRADAQLPLGCLAVGVHLHFTAHVLAACVCVCHA